MSRVDPPMLALTTIPRGKYAIPSDLASQATLGPVSTWIGDGLGIPGAVSFLHFYLKLDRISLVLAPKQTKYYLF